MLAVAALGFEQKLIHRAFWCQRRRFQRIAETGMEQGQRRCHYCGIVATFGAPALGQRQCLRVVARRQASRRRQRPAQRRGFELAVARRAQLHPPWRHDIAQRHHLPVAQQAGAAGRCNRQIQRKQPVLVGGLHQDVVALHAVVIEGQWIAVGQAFKRTAPPALAIETQQHRAAPVELARRRDRAVETDPERGGVVRPQFGNHAGPQFIADAGFALARVPWCAP